MPKFQRKQKQPQPTGLGRPITIVLPRWPVLFYSLGAAILVPWIVYLSFSLPTRDLSNDWDVVWVGFDAFVVIVMVLTAYFAARRSVWVILAATALGTALLVDGWFDVMTAKDGKDTVQAIFLALFGELPVALISWYIALHTTRQVVRSRN
jgi:hypothetical protein